MQNFSLNLLTSALIVSLVSMGAQAVEVRESTNYPEDAQVDEIVVNGNDVVITADKNFTLGKGSILDAAQVKSPNSLTLNVQNGTLTLNAQGNAISLNDKAINTTIKISANQVIYNNPNEDPKRAHYAIYLAGKNSNIIIEASDIDYHGYNGLVGFNEKAYGKVVIHGHINSETQGAFVYADAATEEGYSSLELVYQGESHLTAKQAQIIKNKQVVGVKKSYDQVLRFAQGTIVPSSKSDSLHLIGEVDVRHGQNNKIDLGNKGTWLGGTVTSVAAPNSSSSNTADLNLVLGEGGHWTVTEGTYGLVRVVGGSGRIDIKTYEYESANQIIDLLDQKNILVVLSPEANNTRVSSIMNANKNITFKVDLSQSTSLDSKDEVLLVNMDETTRSVFGEEGKEFSGEKTSFYPETLVLHYDDGVYSKDYKGDKTQFKAAYLKRKPKGSSSSSSSSSTTPSSSPSPLVGEAHRLSLGLGGLVQLDSIVDLPVILTHGHGLWASATGSTMKLDDVRRKQSTLGVGFTQTHQTGKLSQEFGIGLHLTQAKAEDLLKTRRVDVSVFDQFTWNDRHHLELMLNVGRLKHRSDKTVDRFNTNVWGAMLSYNLDVMLPKHFKVIPTVALAFQHQSGYKFVGDHNIHYEAQSSNTSLAHVGLRTEWEGLTSMKPFVSVDHYVPLSGEVDLTASDGRSVLKDHLNKPKSWTSLAAGLTWNIRSNASVSAGVYTEMGGHRHNSFGGSLGLDWKF